MRGAIVARSLLPLRPRLGGIEIPSGALKPATPRWLQPVATGCRPAECARKHRAGQRGSRPPDRLRRCAACAERAVLLDRQAELHRRFAQEAALQLGHEDRQLAARRLPNLAAGTGEPVPGPREGKEVGAAPATVSGEHRADAAMAV